MASKLIESFQTDLPTRVYRVANGFNEALYLAANEPSLGMYRIQEHVQFTVPRVVDQKQALAQVCQRVEGSCYDLDYNRQAVQSMSRVNQFSNINVLLIRCTALVARLSTTSVTSQHKAHRENDQMQDHSTSSLETSKSSCGLLSTTLQLPAPLAGSAGDRRSALAPTLSKDTEQQLMHKCFD